MADLFSMKSPLMISLPNGKSYVMAEYFKHAKGIIFFDVFWQQQPENSIFIVEGEYKGEGPWKVGDAVISVLGCHGCDAELAAQFAEWQMYLQMHSDVYPSENEIHEIARIKGAII